jgi:hypothetical protein
VPIQQAVTSANIPNAPAMTLELGPARPGPNRVIMTVNPAPPEDHEASIEMTATNQSLGVSSIPMNRMAMDGTAAVYVADGALMPAGSGWDVTAVVKAPDGNEIAHNRYVFEFGPAGLVAGKAVPPIDPGFLLGLAFICLGVLGAVYAFAGGSLPRVHEATGRVALASGGVLGSVMGLVLIAFGTNL